MSAPPRDDDAHRKIQTLALTVEQQRQHIAQLEQTVAALLDEQNAMRLQNVELYRRLAEHADRLGEMLPLVAAIHRRLV